MISKETGNKSTSRVTTGPRYWRSLDELHQTPGFKEWMEREFPSGASELAGFNRRHFLKIMGASFAMAGAGMSGCRRPLQHILPYSKQPENVIPGVPVYFASSVPSAKDNIPVIVETHQNRPTKIEGNSGYGAYSGATSIFAQASVLDLYDPDRASVSLSPVSLSPVSWSDASRLSQAQVGDLLASIHRKFTATAGQRLAFLAEESTSPTRARMVKQMIEKFPAAIWAEYEPVDRNNPELAAERIFGRRLRPNYRFGNAHRVLSLDSDFLHTEPGHLQYARDFADARRIYSASEASSMNRLYQVESHFGVTGGMADHRLRLSTSQIPAFAAKIGSAIIEAVGGPRELGEFLARKSDGLDVDAHWIEACVEDLVENRGKSVVLAGSHLPIEVHQITFLINDLLDGVGRTVDYLEVSSHSGATSIAELAEKMSAGRVETLIILGGNPAYNAPGSLSWADLQRGVQETIRFGCHFDETSQAATTHVAANHYLESWGDGRTFDGTVVAVQPMIMPLFEGFSELEVLARLSGSERTDGYELVRETVGVLASAAGGGESFEQFLSDGLLVDSGFKKTAARIDHGIVRKALKGADLAPAEISGNALEVRIIPDNKVWDGRFSNNGWLQECPDPMTKVAWDNLISISPRLAREIGYNPSTARSPLSKVFEFAKASARKDNEFEKGREYAPVGELTVGGVTVNGPVHIQPGLADYTVLVSLGYGRTLGGRVGTNVGFAVYPLTVPGAQAVRTGAALKLSTERVPVANTQEHWSMEGRAIIREGNQQDYEKHGDFVSKMGVEAHSPPVYGAQKDSSLQEKVTNQFRGNSAYETPKFGGAQQWGMSIDLNTCIGCNACVVACQSENSIPIVGKEQVTRGREMHWIRLDRYYSSGDIDENKNVIPEDPQVSLQPMLCQQCEMAPCEQVCPVNATVHDDEGLNVMAYNRCVGTRYCANNCPYKVRRFNFFDWNKREIGHFYEGPAGPKGMPELHKMQKNPDVTVRMRGVMEKCTFCQQRIEEAKIRVKSKARDSAKVGVPDGVIRTACQQVCPTQSIVFGDVADASTRVSQLKTSDRDYAVLGYLNTRPRTTYLAKLRNPNPHMPDFHNMPLSRMEYENAFGHAQHEEHPASDDAHGGAH